MSVCCGGATLGGPADRSLHGDAVEEGGWVESVGGGVGEVEKWRSR